MQLRVDGNSGDVVVLTDLSEWWRDGAAGTMMADGQTYSAYEHPRTGTGSAHLLIDQDFKVAAIALS